MNHRTPGRPADQDPFFVFDYQPLDDPAYAFGADPDATSDGAGRRMSTYWDVEPLIRGPQPPPDWLVTDRAAIDTDLGTLKTGKEADVVLLERAVPGGPAMTVAAKRYRAAEHRSFHRNSTYTDGRSVRRSRDVRALKRKSTWGRTVAAGEWAASEWTALVRCHEAGVAVPYPIQIDGTEILMELVTDADGPAPRLVRTRPELHLLRGYFDQVRDAMATLAALGLAHGDLSPYNILAAGERLVLIDLPQVIDLAGHADGPAFLRRDCHNVCAWFDARGLDVDEEALFADLLVSAFG